MSTDEERTLEQVHRIVATVQKIEDAETHYQAARREAERTLAGFGAGDCEISEVKAAAQKRDDAWEAYVTLLDEAEQQLAQSRKLRGAP